MTPAYIDNIASFLSDKSIVLQGHPVQALSKIAETFPEKAPRILYKLLNFTERLPSNRIDFIIKALEHFLAYERLKPKIRKFVEPYADSEIKVVARKAKKILKKLSEWLTSKLTQQGIFFKNQEKAVPQPEIKHSHQGEIKLVLDWGTTSSPREQMMVINLTKFQEKRS